MIKHRWRELAKSFGNHVDPEKTEQLKRTKSEIENNVTRIFKLIKNEELGKKEGSRKESELVGLIENFYQQYQSLYALYDHLVGESGRIVRSRKERKGFTMSPSSSDSEYYSSEDVDGSNARLDSEHQKLADSLKHDLKTENLEVADLKQKWVSTSEEKEAINSEYLAALRKIKQAEIEDRVKNEVDDERVRELSALVEAHEAHGTQSPARVKELEGQLAGFKMELESLCHQKRDLEAWKEGKAAEAKQLGETNIGLHARVLQLEIVLKEKEDEISDLQKKLKENEDSSTSKISDLMTQASNMQKEVDSMRAKKGELEKKMESKKNESMAQVKGLSDQVNGLQKELKSLRQQKTESEAQLDRKNKDISKHLLQIETLKEELTRKDTVEMKMMEERQRLLEKVKDVELQTDSLRNKRKNLEKQIKSRNHETNKLRQENESLLSKVFELERTLNERGDEICALRREYSVLVTDLTTQVSDLKQELDSLQTKKSQLVMQNKQYLERLTDMDNQNNKVTGKIAKVERENKKNSERLTEVENQNNGLRVKISDQQITLKEQEDTIKKFNKDHKQAKIWFPASKLNLQVAERKMEELAEKYRINIEDNVRLLYQRIRVAEQIHIENKENYKKLKESYENEIRDLKEKLATYEDPVRKMKDISETAKCTFKGLDSVVLKYEEGHQNFLNQITKMSNELESAKTWVAGTAGEIKLLKHNVDCLVTQLNEKEEQEGVLREQVCKLEASASKEAGEKSNLVKSLSKLEKQVGDLERTIKDKDEDLLSLGEEKREAIRQLCVLIDHHRNRYDDLKEAISKRSAATRAGQ